MTEGADSAGEVQVYLHGLLERAFKSRPFDFTCSLLRVGGMMGPGCDPFEESKEAFEATYNPLLAHAQEEHGGDSALRMGLLMYCQAIEMSAPLELLANVVRCIAGQPFLIDPYRDGRIPASKKKKKLPFASRPPSVGWKMRKLLGDAEESGEQELIEFVGGFFDEDVGNAFSHSDYIITEHDFRWNDHGLLQVMALDELADRIGKCFDFYGALLGLHGRWLREMVKVPRYHQWEQYEVLELLANADEGLYGFQVHFSNGQVARYTRSSSGNEAMNVRFEQDGTLNFFVGDLGKLEPVWKIDGRPVTDWSELDQSPSG